MGSTGYRELDGAAFRAWLARARDEIARSRERLNAENLYPVADADTGSNMEATIRAAASAVEDESSQELLVVADAAAQGALHGAQGNSGVLLSQVLRGFADGLRENLPKAFALAHECAFKAVANPQEGTILSVARAAKDAVGNVAAWGSELRHDGEIALAAWKAARTSTLESADNPPSEASRGTIDAGAHGIELIYRSLVAVLDSNLETLSDLPKRDRSDVDHPMMIRKSDGAYEVMYDLINVSEERIEQLRTNLAGIGESLLIVGGVKFWKVHVHTDFVEQAVMFARKVGSPASIRITALDTDSCISGRALITVANGPGFAKLMRESGVEVINAFDSRRVEPQEWVDLVGDGSEAILIPHDPHGLESALLAKELLENSGKVVAVIGSRSPLQALAAISTHTADAISDFNDEVAMMQSAARKTLSITIARAPRQMESAGENKENSQRALVPVGSVIALLDRSIVAFGADEIDVAFRAIEERADESTEIITLVTGNNAPEGIAEELARRITSQFPSIEVTTYFGGQAWYPLLIGIE